MVDIQIIEHVAIVAVFFFFNDTATTEIYTLSLHDALPIYKDPGLAVEQNAAMIEPGLEQATEAFKKTRSEEHTSELQSRLHLVCRLLLEKKYKRPRFMRAIALRSLHTTSSASRSSTRSAQL